MIKMLLGFLIVFGLFFVGIPALRSLSGKQQLALAMTLTWSAVCAVLAVATISLFVILF